MTRKDTLPCCAQVERHRYTTIQRITLYDYKPCTRKGRIELTHANGTKHHMCQQHAKLALQGFIGERLDVTCKASRNDYQQGRVGGTPPDFGTWTTDELTLQHVARDFKADIDYRYHCEQAYHKRRDQHRYG